MSQNKKPFYSTFFEGEVKIFRCFSLPRPLTHRHTHADTLVPQGPLLCAHTHLYTLRRVFLWQRPVSQQTSDIRLRAKWEVSTA